MQCPCPCVCVCVCVCVKDKCVIHYNIPMNRFVRPGGGGGGGGGGDQKLLETHFPHPLLMFSIHHRGMLWNTNMSSQTPFMITLHPLLTPRRTQPLCLSLRRRHGSHLRPPPLSQTPPPPPPPSPPRRRRRRRPPPDEVQTSSINPDAALWYF